MVPCSVFAFRGLGPGSVIPPVIGRSQGVTSTGTQRSFVDNQHFGARLGWRLLDSPVAAYFPQIHRTLRDVWRVCKYTLPHQSFTQWL